MQYPPTKRRHEVHIGGSRRTNSGARCALIAKCTILQVGGWDGRRWCDVHTKFRGNGQTVQQLKWSDTHMYSHGDCISVLPYVLREEIRAKL